MQRARWLTIALAVCLSGGNADAFGWRMAARPVCVAYVAAPVPLGNPTPAGVMLVPAAPPVSPGPVSAPPVPGRIPYAAPTEAPPSAAPAAAEPPRSPRPAVSESRYFDAYPRAADAADPPAGPTGRVSFWNLTAMPLRLTVDGTPLDLAPGKRGTLELARDFVWKVEGREPQAQRLPTGESALEIVIRR